jgi:SAM-dependent methyltransferase
MIDTACKVCGARAWRLAYRQGERDQFVFWRCGSCDLVVNGSPADTSQEKYALPDVRPIGERPPSDGLRQSWETIRRARPAPGRLLDIGCGNGAILQLAARDGWQVAGTELDPAHAALLRERLGLEVHTGTLAGIPDEAPFDVIVLRHVLEHVPDPLGTVREIGSRLAPGGLALLEFPTIDGWDQRLRRWMHRTGLHRHRYAADYRPGHVQEFNRRSFGALVARTPLALEHWETYSVRPLRGWLYRRIPIGNKARALLRRARGLEEDHPVRL